MCWLPTRRSVRHIRRPYCGHIANKTKQDRHLVTMERSKKLAALILLPHSYHPPKRPPLGRVDRLIEKA